MQVFSLFVSYNFYFCHSWRYRYIYRYAKISKYRSTAPFSPCLSVSDSLDFTVFIDVRECRYHIWLRWRNFSESPLSIHDTAYFEFLVVCTVFRLQALLLLFYMAAFTSFDCLYYDSAFLSCKQTCGNFTNSLYTLADVCGLSQFRNMVPQQMNQNHPLNGWFALALQGHITDMCLKARWMVGNRIFFSSSH